jgi:hypothetical protein
MVHVYVVLRKELYLHVSTHLNGMMLKTGIIISFINLMHNITLGLHHVIFIGFRMVILMFRSSMDLCGSSHVRGIHFLNAYL